MSAQILRTTLIRNRPIDPAAGEFQVDLPVNPLSGIIVTMRATINDATSAARDWFGNFAAKYTNWRVTYRGATIIFGNTTDLAVAMALRERQIPSPGNVSRTDGDAISFTFPLLFGRKLYDAMECFPATRRGDLVLTLNFGADVAQLDNHTLQVETIELLDAKPARFVKTTTLEQAMAAAGENTIELPIGNKLIGAVLRPFTFPDGVSFLSSFGEIALLVDNVEVIDARVNFDTTHGMIARRVNPLIDFLNHDHGFLDAAAGQTDTQPVSELFAMNRAYGYLDWDPLDDDAYLIDTRGAAHVQLQMQSGTADGANTSRVLPIECVDLGTGQATT